MNQYGTGPYGSRYGATPSLSASATHGGPGGASWRNSTGSSQMYSQPHQMQGVQNSVQPSMRTMPLGTDRKPFVLDLDLNRDTHTPSYQQINNNTAPPSPSASQPHQGKVGVPPPMSMHERALQPQGGRDAFTDANRRSMPAGSASRLNTVE
eukprot:Tamp_36134.p2 GENE.Tamp_36134~~Tamp_36134.p2  ORF type:complete len:152 (+),score=14.15 Tamp_36134:27-482(+)